MGTESAQSLPTPSSAQRDVAAAALHAYLHCHCSTCIGGRPEANERPTKPPGLAELQHDAVRLEWAERYAYQAVTWLTSRVDIQSTRGQASGSG